MLKAKYFRGTRLRCLEGAHVSQKGSSIHQICLKALPLFIGGLHWVPGNGKLINIWKDSVLGKIPPHLPRLQQRMDEMKLTTLWDISNWENSEGKRWMGWHLPELPDELDEEKSKLLVHLIGIAPLCQNKKDKRGWGDRSGYYTSIEGYQRFSADFNVPGNPKSWNYNWSNTTLPKIDLFTWTLLHGRILTGENLEKKGIAGPFRCPLCAIAGETITHLFFTCSYAKSVWKGALNSWGGLRRMPEDIHDCLHNWERLYQGELCEKKGVRSCWLKIPKLICWCLWKERNYRIFQDKKHPPCKIVIKIQALLMEIISISKLPSNKGSLTEKEREWMRNVKPLADNFVAAKQMEAWEIRMDNSQFGIWLKERKIFKLFFDGASKGNPGKAGGGGVITNADGEVVVEYSWNIGYETNNIAEAYGLWQGLKQLLVKKVDEVMVFGDSRIIIQAMNGGRKSDNNRIARLSRRIRSISKLFRKVRFYHILRDLNALADMSANKAIDADLNGLIVNSVVQSDIPF